MTKVSELKKRFPNTFKAINKMLLNDGRRAKR